MEPGRVEQRLDRRTGMSQPDMHDRPDLYDLLEVDPSTTFVEVRAAYRRRTLALHGDSLDRTRAPEARTRATEMLRELNEAYRTLRNPPLRNEHDFHSAGRRQLIPSPASSSPAAPRPTVRRTRPAIGTRRNLGRMAIVLGFGLLVLWAVLADRVERRNAEANLLSQPPSGATTEPLR